MEKTQQSELKKEAVTFLGLVLFMAIAVGYKTVTDNRTVHKQNTCRSIEDDLKLLYSRGARVEYAIARELKLPIFYE